MSKKLICSEKDTEKLRTNRKKAIFSEILKNYSTKQFIRSE